LLLVSLSEPMSSVIYCLQLELNALTLELGTTRNRTFGDVAKHRFS
jgi:hypothetical protein